MLDTDSTLDQASMTDLRTASVERFDMHGISIRDFLNGFGGFLGCYYLSLALMNGVAAFYCCGTTSARPRSRRCRAGVRAGRRSSWLLVALACDRLRQPAMRADPPDCRSASRTSINRRHRTGRFTRVGTTSCLLVLFVFRQFFVAAGRSPGRC